MGKMKSQQTTARLAIPADRVESESIMLIAVLGASVSITKGKAGSQWSNTGWM